ncbi:filament-like plant protein [Sesamum indicum]|uniref:Filament-like plant protein n=1 Tax=Sesamum indicum TaxID=4182 RepID=A0A6I9SVW2_SESIN|nr:filament-like plant protein [Sesamum indicum]
MEKRKWLWKRKSSERSPGESDNSGSFSSHSERYSGEQETLQESPKNSSQSPEVTSKITVTDDEVRESVKTLTEKLSAALVNVSAKEDLVKQHAKVAEEAVAGWEKAENEVAALKQQLEVAVQQNLNLEVKTTHLDGALKECVRQLRQARDEQEKRITDAVAEKNIKWESTKAELEQQILDLKAEADASRYENAASTDPNTLLILEALEKENRSLKQEIVSRCKELEIITTERDLSTQAAETASKLQLESIKKVAKLEAECRRLQSIARKSSPLNNQKSVAASCFCAESLTDSRSVRGERRNIVDIDTRKNNKMEANGSERSCSDSWASALISELDQFKNEKPSPKSLAAYSVEIDMMDDFLEMERLAALHETKNEIPFTAPQSGSEELVSLDNPLKAELESMTQQVSQLENKLGKIEAEKLELENALDESLDSLKAAQRRLEQAEIRLDELQKELAAVNETKELLELQLIGVEVESRTMSANVDSLKAEIEEEKKLSAELTVKCRELENELTRKIQETELEQQTHSNGELKIKQEDLAVAADKLAECQKTIASLGRQLKSLATLEDFLIDTSNLPGLSGGQLVSRTGGEVWRITSNQTFLPQCDSDRSRTSMENCCNLGNGNEDSSLSSSLSAPSTNHITAAKTRNSFGKLFSLSKSISELENGHD